VGAFAQPRVCGTIAAAPRLWLFEFAQLLLVPQAHAGTWGPDESTLSDLANDSTTQLMNMQVLGSVRSSASGRPPASSGGHADVSVGAPPAQSVALEMAGLYPASQQKQAETYFCNLLKAYDSLQSRLGLKPYDLAGGLATFISGNFIAYTGRTVADADFKALALQIKASLSANTNLAKISRVAIGRTHEQLVIYGMNVALYAQQLQQKPDSQARAQMKQNAKRQLEALFAVSAEKIDISSKGVVILP
jgi:hypothetical protein